jgi:hypothetical protein
MGPRFGEGQGDAASDPPTSTGHDGHLVVKSETIQDHV